MWTLYRDGAKVAEFISELEMWRYIHMQHCYSVSHAFQHEGYTATGPDGRTYGREYMQMGTE